MRETTQRVDAWELARKGNELHGVAALSGFERLLSGLPEQVASEVKWDLGGETENTGRRFLALHAEATVKIECQRCLEFFDLALVVDNRLELVETETEIEAEDDTEEDPDGPDRVLGTTHLDVLALVEDELILALPYVPKHDVCPSLPKGLESDQGSESVRPSPFAVLAELKKD